MDVICLKVVCFKEAAFLAVQAGNVAAKLTQAIATASGRRARLCSEKDAACGGNGQIVKYRPATGYRMYIKGVTRMRLFRHLAEETLERRRHRSPP